MSIIKNWQTALANYATKFKVISGTKNGRPRKTTILDRTKVINAVNNIIQKRAMSRFLAKMALETVAERLSNDKIFILLWIVYILIIFVVMHDTKIISRNGHTHIDKYFPSIL